MKTDKKMKSDAGNSATAARLEEVRSWMEKLRFRKCLFGVDEADVWKKIGELNSLYEAALAAERVRYDTLLKERVNFITAYIENELGVNVPMPMETEKSEYEA